MKRFFTHPLLDDLPLKVIPFRVYCHLLRRAGNNGICKTKVDQIAKACRIDRKTIFPALTTLEKMGLIRRWKKFQGCNHYLVPWPPIVGENGTIEVAETELQSSHKTELKVSLLKKPLQKVKRAFGAVTDSASASCGTSPHAADADPCGASPLSLDDSKRLALEIRQEEAKADPYSNFAIFPPEDFERWAEDWQCRIAQDGPPRNPAAALRGYLRKAVNRNSKKFLELHEATTSDGEPPF